MAFGSNYLVVWEIQDSRNQCIESQGSEKLLHKFASSFCRLQEKTCNWLNYYTYTFENQRQTRTIDEFRQKDRFSKEIEREKTEFLQVFTESRTERNTASDLLWIERKPVILVIYYF